MKRKGIKELKQEARNFKLVFAGSGPFAEPIFESSARKFKDVALIIKRGTPKDSGVFLIAKKNNLKIFEISDKNELHQEIKGLKPDIAIVVSFGIIISGKTLEIPQYGFINVHYSLLPKYRGPSPVQTALLNGDKVSGITFQKMSGDIDEGAILYQEEVSVSDSDTTETLGEKMALLSARKLPEIIEKYTLGAIKPKKQSGEPSYSKIIRKSDGQIDWSESAEKIERQIRAYTPWPGAYTFWNGKMVRIIEAETLPSSAKGLTLGRKVGTFFEFEINTISVSRMTKLYGIQTRKGVLIIKKLQLEGKKAMATAEFIKGYQNIVGSVLGKTKQQNN